MRLGALTASLLQEDAICDPQLSELASYPPVPYDALFDLLSRALGDHEHFVLAAFPGAAIWFSMAGSVARGKLVALTTTQGLFPPGVHWQGGDWKTSYQPLLRHRAAAL